MFKKIQILVQKFPFLSFLKIEFRLKFKLYMVLVVRILELNVKIKNITSKKLPMTV